MVRVRPIDRLHDIIEAATVTFMNQGYRSARIGDVAKRAGVSPGTIYLYAENKEALFDLVMRRALGDPAAVDFPLPYSCPHAGRTIDRLWRHFQRIARFERLGEAARSSPVRDDGAEFEGVVRELFAWLSHHRIALQLIERCAGDWPELHGLYYKQFRRNGLQVLAEYLDTRTKAGCLRPMPDSQVAARLILEMCSYFAIDRHTAPDSQGLDGRAAEETVVVVLKNAFVMPAA